MCSSAMHAPQAPFGVICAAERSSADRKIEPLQLGWLSRAGTPVSA